MNADVAGQRVLEPEENRRRQRRRLFAEGMAGHRQKNFRAVISPSTKRTTTEANPTRRYGTVLTNNLQSEGEEAACSWAFLLKVIFSFHLGRPDVPTCPDFAPATSEYGERRAVWLRRDPSRISGSAALEVTKPRIVKRKPEQLPKPEMEEQFSITRHPLMEAAPICHYQLS